MTLQSSICTKILKPCKTGMISWKTTPTFESKTSENRWQSLTMPRQCLITWTRAHHQPSPQMGSFFTVNRKPRICKGPGPPPKEDTEDGFQWHASIFCRIVCDVIDCATKEDCQWTFFCCITLVLLESSCHFFCFHSWWSATGSYLVVIIRIPFIIKPLLVLRKCEANICSFMICFILNCLLSCCFIIPCVHVCFVFKHKETNIFCFLRNNGHKRQRRRLHDLDSKAIARGVVQKARSQRKQIPHPPCSTSAFEEEEARGLFEEEDSD